MSNMESLEQKAREIAERFIPPANFSQYEYIRKELAAAILALATPAPGHVRGDDGVDRKVLESAGPEQGVEKIGELLCRHHLESGETVMVLAKADSTPGASRVPVAPVLSRKCPTCCYFMAYMETTGCWSCMRTGCGAFVDAMGKVTEGKTCCG